MTTPAGEAQAAPEAAPPAPRLLHTGTYALYETPTGGRHLVYRREQAADEEGRQNTIADPVDEHLPDFPAESLPLLSQFLDHGIPAPILAVLQGKASPAAMLAQLRAMGGPGE